MKVTPENISRIAKSLLGQENLTAEQLQAATKEISSGFDDAGVFSAAKMNKNTTTSQPSFAGRPINDTSRGDPRLNMTDFSNLSQKDIDSGNVNGPEFFNYIQKNKDNLDTSFYDHNIDNQSSEAINKRILNHGYTDEQLKKNANDLYDAGGKTVDTNPFLHTDQGRQALDYLFNTNAGKEYSDEALSNLAAGYERTGEYGLGMMSLPTKSNGLMGMMGANEFGAAIGGGIIGGAVNSAMGGDFESGFMAGGFAGGLGKSITKNIAGSASDMMRLEKSAIGKVLDENKSYDEMLESRRNAYLAPEREIEELRKREASEIEELKKTNQEVFKAKNDFEAYKNDPMNSVPEIKDDGTYNIDAATGLPKMAPIDDNFFEKARKNINKDTEAEFERNYLIEGQRPELKTSQDFDNAVNEQIDFQGKKVTVRKAGGVNKSNDELYDQHVDEYDYYKQMYDSMNHGTPINNGKGMPLYTPNQHSLFKDYDDFEQTFRNADPNADADDIISTRRAELSPEYKKQIDKANDMYFNMDSTTIDARQNLYDQINATRNSRMDLMNEAEKHYKEKKAPLQSLEKRQQNLMKSTTGEDLKKAEDELTKSGPRLKGGDLDNELHKEMLKEASQKDLGSEAGFFQKRAQNMIKPGTRDSGKSTGIESRHMVLGGAALAGGIFGNRKRDHSRGFNSHRGSRI
jgi:hypothetical protein